MRRSAILLILTVVIFSSVQFGSAQGSNTSPLKDQSWVRLGGPQGGIGYDIRMNPENPDIMYVTDANAGIHKSLDGGKSWFQVNTGILTRTGPTGDIIPIFSASIDSNNPDTIWIGTQGEKGIYKSTDGGATWELKINGIKESSITFRGFTIDEHNSDIVYAAGEIPSHEWFGEVQNGFRFDKTKGKVYRTENGGDSWYAIWSGDNLARYVWLDPRDSDVIYISTGIFDREAANTDVSSGFPGGIGILKSTDGGKTWRVLDNDGELPPYYAGSLFMNPENPEVLLAAVGHDHWSFGGNSPNGVLLSEDGGESWKMVLEEHRGVMMAVEFCISDPKVAYAASSSYFYRSSDDGKTWTHLAKEEGFWGPPGIIGSQPIDIQCDPRDPNVVFVNNYIGGNLVSYDGGKNWETASRGYSGAQITGGIEVDPNKPGRLYVGARSGLFLSNDGGFSWQGLAYEPVRYNQINAIAVNPKNFEEIVSSPWDVCWGIAHSQTGGSSWSILEQGFPEGVCENEQEFVDLDFAPSDPSIIYLTGGDASCRFRHGCQETGPGIFQFDTDGRKTWKSITGEIFDGRNISGLSVHPTNSKILYVTTYAQGIFLSENGGDTWEEIGSGSGFQGARVLTINPFDPSILYVGTGGFGMFRSEDGGSSWALVSSGLHPEAFIVDIVVDPSNPNNVWAADVRGGVFYSADYGKTWTEVNQGLTNRSITALGISSDGLTLYAGSDGGGVFRLSVHDQAFFDEHMTPLVETTSPTSPTLIPPTKLATEPPEIVSAEATDVPEEPGSNSTCLGSLIIPFAFLGLISWKRRNQRGLNDM